MTTNDAYRQMPECAPVPDSMPGPTAEPATGSEPEIHISTPRLILYSLACGLLWFALGWGALLG